MTCEDVVVRHAALAGILAMFGPTHGGHASFKPRPLGRHEGTDTRGSRPYPSTQEVRRTGSRAPHSANPCTLHFRHLRQDSPRARSRCRQPSCRSPLQTALESFFVLFRRLRCTRRVGSVRSLGESSRPV
ncbi:hypothetical protein L227DRAFT_571489 [Lentinus tigrinus ALCF2SS1-6]|uniref:Uncharacterized protein n=1 Tax=Lentinus tigrinus ALCF2SS1-6 TaxID=1328759 RepID=A0A5C2SPL2_9APHY|nr:hypothetical protein L227DRAFT_571489 [Lentinus tigrinus ALCF2SS1-6]